MNNVFFSIILPTYNRAYCIGRAIESVINQTFIYWELIIIDDGSTDDTKAVVKRYNDPRIKYVWQENQERSAARNHGISLAQGEWICFLDSDDEYLPEHLQVHHDEIIEHPKFKVFKTGLLYFEKGMFKKKSDQHAENFMSLFPYDFIFTFSFHKNVFIDEKFDVRFFVLEDLHLLIRVGQQYQIKYIHDWTYQYNYDPGQSGGVGKNYEKNLTNRKSCIQDMLSFKVNPVKTQLKWIYCLAEILMLSGHLKYNKSKILPSMMDNLRTFMQFPKKYIQLVFRIIYVKWGEWSGWYHTEDRF